MTTSRPVRIVRGAPTSLSAAPTPTGPPEAATEGPRLRSATAPVERRPNVAGSQRAVRVTLVYLVVLVALYAAFVLYDRTAPGGTASPSANGLLLFTGIFVVFAVAGPILTLHPAPRWVEVGPDRVTVRGRWGRRRALPPLESLSTRVVRRYPSGWMSDNGVEQVEVWGPDAPVRAYLAEEGLFRGAKTSGTDR